MKNIWSMVWPFLVLPFVAINVHFLCLISDYPVGKIALRYIGGFLILFCSGIAIHMLRGPK